MSIKFIKCEILMSQLRMEEFDSDGKPIVVEKQDMFGNNYMERKEITYRRGAVVALPEAVIKKLGKSVAMVMVPQVDEPIVDIQPVVRDGEFKLSGREKTVADMIPKDKDDKGNDSKDKDSKNKGKNK